MLAAGAGGAAGFAPTPEAPLGSQASSLLLEPSLLQKNEDAGWKPVNLSPSLLCKFDNSLMAWPGDRESDARQQL
jgi:hypothetical protein